ncbi:hypothetical protein [Natranaeroarchaeum aerophilus]|uniref:Uncharacterized protein n=1 Tax=Natranaeroarchaeum aerophilus TaxID=2917711 RepID=A0AAE3FV61_9EURY|nr:hypothetical protein [Natranaeroarchaeum aerophilus]MCL9815164.1 hypothetical protein [Natranaeroarchaeum aerophilus]
MAVHRSTDNVKRLTIAVAIVAAVLSGALVSSVVATEDGIDRNGHDLEIDLSDVEDPDEVTVNVTDPDVELQYTESVEEADDVVSIDVSDPDSGTIGDADLTAATVNVTAEAEEGTETVEEDATVDLSYATFDEDVPVWIDDDQVRVPLDGDGTAGFDGNATVGVAPADEDVEFEEINATVRDDGTQLSVEHAALVEAVSGAESIELDVRSDGASIAAGTVTHAPELRSVNDELVVWQPLIEDDGEYTVTENGEDVEDVSSEHGTIALNSQTVDDEFEVEITEEEGLEFSISGSEADLSPLAVNATLSDDGVMFDQGLAELDVSAAIAEGEETRPVTVGDEINEERVLGLEDAEITADDELLLSTDAGVLAVSLDQEQTEESTEWGSHLLMGGLILVPLLFGGVLSVAVSRIAPSPDLWDLILTGLLALGLLTIVQSIALILTENTLPLEQIHAVAASGAILGVIASMGGYRLLGSAGGSGSTAFTVDVKVTDGERKLQGRTAVAYEEVGGDRSGNQTVRNGTGQVKLPDRGKWDLTAASKTSSGVHRSDSVTVNKRSSDVSFVITLPTQVTVVDKTSGEPIADAVVQREDGSTTTTGRDGTVTLDAPDDGASERVEIDHKKYRTAEQTVKFGNRSDRTVELEPRTGRVQIVSQIDGVPTEGIELHVTPVRGEQYLRERTEEVQTTTGRDGVATLDDLLIGEYRVRVPTPNGSSDRFEGSEKRVTVRDGQTTKVEVNTRFTWTLSTDQRSRIDRIRRDVDALSDDSRRDTTIPQYYGSIVESMLDAVETLPSSGHQFVATSVDPDTVADATLDAADRTVEAINDAMTTKRNVDLFAACTDMPNREITWSGEFEIAELLDRLDSEPAAQRNEVKERYESVADLIESRRGGVSEIGPAKEMHQRAWEMVRETNRGDEAIVTAYTALLMLDAIEELFEHDALHERLSRTVF